MVSILKITLLHLCFCVFSEEEQITCPGEINAPLKEKEKVWLNTCMIGAGL